MANNCELLEICGFFKKYREMNDIVCAGWILRYCLGDKQAECLRKKYRKEHNTPPPDDMMPNGQTTQMKVISA